MDSPKCWICGDTATTGEHLIKKSDLAGIFGNPKPRQPLFLHNAKKKNVKIQGLNADALKLPKCLCAKCNNERSQPYDRAWEEFSKSIRGRSKSLAPGNVIRGNRIFLMKSNESLRRVQLYFVKLFGCLIQTYKIPICLESFKNAIIEGKFHPDVFIKVGCMPRDDHMVGVAALTTATNKDTNNVCCAQWFYELDQFVVNVIYATDHDFWTATEGAWHPKHGTGRLLVHDFSDNIRVADQPAL